MSERALHCPVCPSDKNISTTMMTPSVEQWWDDSIWRETKWSERNLSSATFVRHKHHMDWPGIEPGSPRWEAGDYPPEPWHVPIINMNLTHAVTVHGYFAMFPHQILLCWVQFTVVFKSAVTTMCELITFGRQWIRINISLLRVCASIWKCNELI